MFWPWPEAGPKESLPPTEDNGMTTLFEKAFKKAVAPSGGADVSLFLQFQTQSLAKNPRALGLGLLEFVAQQHQESFGTWANRLTTFARFHPHP